MDSTQFLEQKSKILNENKFNRIELNTSEIFVEDTKTILLSGRDFEMDTYTFKKLCSSMNIHSSLFKEFNSNNLNIEAEDRKKIINELSKLLRKNKDKKLELTFDLDSKKIVNILDTKYAKINQELVIDSVGEFMNNEAFEVKTFKQDDHGNLLFDIVHKKEDSIKGMINENFYKGISITADRSKLESNLYALRLICTNGAIGNKTIASLTYKHHELDKIARLASSYQNSENVGLINNLVHDMKKNIILNSNIPASYRETSYALNLINKNILNEHVSRSIIKEETTLIDIENIFYTNYGNPLTHSVELPADASFYRTNISRWELINQLTHLASITERNIKPVLSERGVRIMQAAAGKMLETKPDLAPTNLKQVF